MPMHHLLSSLYIAHPNYVHKDDFRNSSDRNFCNLVSSLLFVVVFVKFILRIQAIASWSLKLSGITVVVEMLHFLLASIKSISVFEFVVIRVRFLISCSNPCPFVMPFMSGLFARWRWFMFMSPKRIVIKSSVKLPLQFFGKRSELSGGLYMHPTMKLSASFGRIYITMHSMFVFSTTFLRFQFISSEIYIATPPPLPLAQFFFIKLNPWISYKP